MIWIGVFVRARLFCLSRLATRNLLHRSPRDSDEVAERGASTTRAVNQLFRNALARLVIAPVGQSATNLFQGDFHVRRVLSSTFFIGGPSGNHRMQPET